MYGGNELIRDIAIHIHKNKSGNIDPSEDQNSRTTRTVIQYGGGVKYEDIPDSKSKWSGKTYSNDMFGENGPSNHYDPTKYGKPAPYQEGQPGQPLPLTTQPPQVPIYR